MLNAITFITPASTNYYQGSIDQLSGVNCLGSIVRGKKSLILHPVEHFIRYSEVIFIWNLDLYHYKYGISFRLFDALICPEVSYGSQVWMSSTYAFDQIIFALLEPNQSVVATHSYLPKIATDPIERIHHFFLKWTLEVSKYASNTTIWVIRVAIP